MLVRLEWGTWANKFESRFVSCLNGAKNENRGEGYNDINSTQILAVGAQATAYSLHTDYRLIVYRENMERFEER